MEREPRPSDPERSVYWGRRRADAVRLLPFLGILLFLLPLLFSLNPGALGSTARVGLYLFAVWALLIACAAWLSRRLDGAAGGDPTADSDATDAVPKPGDQR